jgi:hypothetical protein
MKAFLLFLAIDQVVCNNPGVVDFIREVVWGGGVFAHGISVRRENSSTSTIDEEFILSPDGRRVAQERMSELERIPDDRPLSNGKKQAFCSVGACCGWGHRLMRQAKAFTYVHYLQNKTMLMEWSISAICFQ